MFQPPGSGAWVLTGSMQPAELRYAHLPQVVPASSASFTIFALLFLSDTLVGSSCDVHVGTSSLLSSKGSQNGEKDSQEKLSVSVVTLYG